MLSSMIPIMPTDLKRSGTSTSLDFLARCGSGHCGSFAHGGDVGALASAQPQNIAYMKMLQELGDPSCSDYDHVFLVMQSFKKRKTDADENMLWRQRLKARQAGASGPLPDDLLTPSVNRNGGNAIRPKQNPAPANQSPRPKNKQVKTAVLSFDP